MALSLSIVILSYNRCDALRRTLGELRLHRDCSEAAQVIVADNASKDSSARMVQEEFPSVLWVKQASNLGVETFNLGAGSAGRDLLLLLDDDSWPDAMGVRPCNVTDGAKAGHRWRRGCFPGIRVPASKSGGTTTSPAAAG